MLQLDNAAVFCLDAAAADVLDDAVGGGDKGAWGQVTCGARDEVQGDGEVIHVTRKNESTKVAGNAPVPWQMTPACSPATTMQLDIFKWPRLCTTMASVTSLKKRR